MSDRMAQDRKENEDRKKGDYPIIKQIKKEKPNIFRIVDPLGYVKFSRAWVVCDDGEKRSFIVENENEGKSIIARALGDKDNYYRGGILESRKDDYGKKYFAYEAQNPDLIKQIAYNNDLSNRNGSWRPKKEFAFNIIDRDLEIKEDGSTFDWCAENKHSKIVTMGPTAFDTLVDTRDNDGSLDEYDVNYLKKGEGLNTTHTIRRAGNQLPGVVQGPLSDVEKQYAIYDLQKAYRLSSARYMKKYLIQTFMQIDEVLGTSYVQELEKQAQIEQELWDAQQKETGGDAQDDGIDPPAETPSEGSGTSVPPVAPPPAASTPPPITPRGRAAKAAAPESGGKMVKCGNINCGKDVPENTEVCPHCNTQLLAPCDECDKLFSTFEYVCPHCGATYETKSTSA